MNTALTSLAHQSRPGSLEARIVHHCTCKVANPDADRSRRWQPDFAMDWVDVLSFDCPAHGELLRRAERQAVDGVVDGMRRRLLAGQDHSEHVPDIATAWVETPPDNTNARKRTLPQRLWDACIGALNGWRGWT